MVDRKSYCTFNAFRVIDEREPAYVHDAPAGTTIDRVQEPDYWRSVVSEFERMAASGLKWPMIKVISDTGEWETWLRVYALGPGIAKTRPLFEWVWKAKAGRKPALPAGYNVEHIAGRGWRALTDGGDIVRDGLQVEEEAIRAAAEHHKIGRKDAA